MNLPMQYRRVRLVVTRDRRGLEPGLDTDVS